MATRGKTLRVRMNAEEWALLDNKAFEAGLSMSELVRASLDTLSVRNRKDQRERNIALNRINANLNVIAKWCNTYRANAERVEVLSHLVAIEREIKSL